jgi:hypothetical protein
MDQGSAKQPDPDPDCVKLESNNAAVRNAAGDAGAGSTVSTAKVDYANGGPSRVLAGPSDGSLVSSVPVGNLVQGGSSDEIRDGKKPVPLCNGQSYTHSAGGFGRHGETRVMNELSEGRSMAGATLTFSVDWRYRLPGRPETFRSNTPCRNCYRALCALATACDVKIFFCSGGKQKVPFEEKPGECNQTPARKKKGERITAEERQNDPFDKLAKRMGEPSPEGLGAI